MDVVLSLLFTHPIGILSLFTIVFIIGMGFYLSAWMKRKMNDPEE
jgi:Flp pilus assembly protein TadB